MHAWIDLHNDARDVWLTLVADCPVFFWSVENRCEALRVNQFLLFCAFQEFWWISLVAVWQGTWGSVFLYRMPLLSRCFFWFGIRSLDLLRQGMWGSTIQSNMPLLPLNWLLLGDTLSVWMGELGFAIEVIFATTTTSLGTTTAY